MILLGRVQGFCSINAKKLALEQRKTVLKALACKDDCVVQYTLFITLSVEKNGEGQAAKDEDHAQNENDGGKCKDRTVCENLVGDLGR